MKYFQVIAVSLSLALGFTSLAWGAVDAQDLEGLPLTLEEYYDAWVSYLEDRLDYARQQGDERLENAMLWIFEHITKESIAERLREGDLSLRSIAENVVFEWEDEHGTGHFWVGSTVGKAMVKIDPPPITDNQVYEFSLASFYEGSAEKWNVSVNYVTSSYGIDFSGGTGHTGIETGFHAPDGLDSPAGVREWRFGSG